MVQFFINATVIAMLMIKISIVEGFVLKNKSTKRFAALDFCIHWLNRFTVDMRGVNELIQVLGADRVISIIIFITIKNSIAATYFTDRINCQITTGLEFLFGKTFHPEILHLSLLVLKITCSKFSLV